MSQVCSKVCKDAFEASRGCKSMHFVRMNVIQLLQQEPQQLPLLLDDYVKALRADHTLYEGSMPMIGVVISPTVPATL